MADKDVLRIIGDVEIARLRLAADDVLVIRVDRAIPSEVADRIRAHVGSMLPEGVKCLVLDSSITLEIVDASVAARAGGQR